MARNVVRETGENDFAESSADETRFGTVWALLWLIMKAERQAVALTLVGDKSNAAGGESLKRWAEPQLAVFRRDEDVPLISWRRVARLLRHLPCNQG